MSPSARPAPPTAAGERDRRHAGHHHHPDGSAAETVAQPVKIDNDLYVRDYSRCIMCYKCVKACGIEAQFIFAISATGRAFDARIATEYNVERPSPPLSARLRRGGNLELHVQQGKIVNVS
jgi:NADP-reducing hydrogenase subunit HndD